MSERDNELNTVQEDSKCLAVDRWTKCDASTRAYFEELGPLPPISPATFPMTVQLSIDHYGSLKYVHFKHVDSQENSLSCKPYSR
ncbi:hypothetical protein NPIL_245771 [Nephila pilipes]|uniref:Uncharacterized protein n=1 Tax=Nephila pilipes TaxID=299642 RepID=A0A8X6MDV5_NEPPI|nr:hypothetical protein NPIL_245771 [Nephila pilipes]